MAGQRRAAAAVVVAVTAVASGLAGLVLGPAMATVSEPLDVWKVAAVHVPTNDVAYDPYRDVVLATVPGTNPNLGNQLVEFDPETAAVGRRVYVGSDPGAIALTDDGTAAFVGQKGSNRITRVDLAAFSVTQQFSVGHGGFFGPRYVEDIEAAPLRNDLVIASLMYYGLSPRHAGVYAFENGVELPDNTAGHTGANRIEFGGPTTVYGYNNETTEYGFRTMALSPTGITTTSTKNTAMAGFSVDFEISEGLVYTTGGLVMNPETGEAVRSFTASGLLEVTPLNDRVTFVSGPQVKVFDATTGVPMGSRTIAGLPGSSRTLVATANGFALASDEGLFLLGPSVTPGFIAPPLPPPTTITDMKATTVSLRSRDAEYDASRNLVYVSVPSGAPASADMVVALDADTGEVKKSVFVGSDPGPLALSGDNSVLHVGQTTIGRVAQIDLVTFLSTGSFSLGNGSYGPRRAEDIDVLPGTANTVAVAMYSSGISPRSAGIALFDNGVQRPSLAPGNRIELASDTAAYSINNETTAFDFYRLSVGPNGFTLVDTTGELVPAFGSDIEFRNGLLYSNIGIAVDPAGPAQVGRYGEGGATETVSSAGRTYFASGASLAEYDTSTFRLIARRPVQTGASALVATAHGLASAGGDKVVLFSAKVPTPQLPVVTSVTPSVGPADGGNRVRIKGSGFTRASSVRFDTTSASFTFIHDGEISAVAPSHSAGEVHVRVTTPGGTSATGYGSTYRYEGTPTTTTTPTTTGPPPPAPAKKSGYWMVGLDGSVYAFGDAVDYGEVMLTDTFAMDLEPTKSKNGYWVVDYDGNVYAFGDAKLYGGGPALGEDEFVTSISRTASGNGYWMFTTYGRVIPFGDAVWRGDMSGVALNGPVLDSIPTPSGNGYYMVASDGGIFCFGDARFDGSMGGKPLNAPVQSLVPDPDGRGYWLVASDGGIFAFSAPFYGSMGGKHLNAPVSGMVGQSGGYLMVALDGGIFAFGNAVYRGSLGSNPPDYPIISVAAY